MAGINIEDRASFTDPVRLPVIPEGDFIGPALQRVGAEMDQAGTQMYRAKQAGAILRAKTDLFADLRQAQLAAMDTPDPDAALKSYQDAAGKAQAKVSQYGFDDYTRGRIALAFEHQNALTLMDVNHDAHAKVINQAQADLMADFQQHVQGAANDPSVDKADWQESFRHTLEVAKTGGIVSPLKAQEMQIQFNRETDHSAALSLGYAAPGTAYQKLDEKTSDGNFANFKSLNPTDRAQLKEQVVNHSISLMRFQEAQESRMEREASKQLKQQQDAMAADFYAHAVAHDDPDFEKHLLASRDSLGPVNFEKISNSLKTGAFGDDKDTVLKINADLYSSQVPANDVRASILTAYKDGRITEATMASLNKTSLEFEASGGKPKILAPVDIAEKWLHTVTGADNQDIMSKMSGAPKVRVASAIADYATWKAAHRNADYATARKEAERLAGEWVHSVHLDSASTLPRPTGVPWTRTDKGDPDFPAILEANEKLKETDFATYTKNMRAIGAQYKAWQQKQADQAKLEAASGTKQ